MGTSITFHLFSMFVSLIGKDIEILLLKKQLCEKFLEFQNVQIDSIPFSLFKKVHFEPGSVNLGKLVFPNDDRKLFDNDDLAIDHETNGFTQKYSEKSTQVETRVLNGK
jgi:hypothetical protein